MPQLGDDDGLLRVAATGVCGSDAAAFHGALDWPLPCALGHEIVGRIEQLGADAKRRWGLEEGQLVAVEEYLPCGTCAACTAGFHQTCRWRSRYGATPTDQWPGLWGGYSDFLYLDRQSLLHPVPDGCSPQIAQLFIPIANGLHWVQGVGECGVGDDVVIIGPGPHGLGCVVGAREAGASTITVIGLSRDQERLSVAKRLGATTTLILESPEDDVAEAVRDTTDGRMAATVVNTAGAPSALTLSVALASERATIVQIGVATETSSDFPVREVWRKVLTIRGARGRPSRLIPVALRLIAAGRYPLDLLCTHSFDVADSEEAVRLVHEGGDGVVRALISPTV